MVQISVFDYEKKQELITAFQPGALTTGRLLRLIDFDHERLVFSVQWLWVLGHYDQKLVHLQPTAL